MPEQIERVTLTTDGSPQRLANVLKNAGLVTSTSDGNRMIDQGAVRILRVNETGTLADLVPRPRPRGSAGGRRSAAARPASGPVRGLESDTGPTVV